MRRLSTRGDPSIETTRWSHPPSPSSAATVSPSCRSCAARSPRPQRRAQRRPARGSSARVVRAVGNSIGRGDARSGGGGDRAPAAEANRLMALCPRVGRSAGHADEQLVGLEAERGGNHAAGPGGRRVLERVALVATDRPRADTGGGASRPATSARGAADDPRDLVRAGGTVGPAGVGEPLRARVADVRASSVPPPIPQRADAGGRWPWALRRFRVDGARP